MLEAGSTVAEGKHTLHGEQLRCGELSLRGGTNYNGGVIGRTSKYKYDDDTTGIETVQLRVRKASYSFRSYIWGDHQRGLHA